MSVTLGDPIGDAVRSIVASGALAGAATVVWRDGRVAHQGSYGWRDREADLPFTPDTIVRIASMSKPITSVAALMLLEEGRFALDDPITDWAPEFSNMRVLASPDSPLDQSSPARRPITFADLMTHRAGFTYGSFHRGPIGAAYRDALGGDIDNDRSPDEWIARLAALPLIDQPGATLHYGHSTDLLGLLIARMEGAPLGDVLRCRIFEPLEMVDTGFLVPRDRWDRRSKAYGFDESGALVVLQRCPGNATVVERPEHMEFVSGGQGLWSTANDFLRFARLFVGGGRVDGVQIVRPETLGLMTSNHLTPEQRVTAEVGGMPLFRDGHGFGLGVAVVVDSQGADPTVCGGNRGAAGWPGGYGGWWRADVEDNSVLVFLAQNMVELSQLQSGIGFGVYEAITGFQQLAGR